MPFAGAGASAYAGWARAAGPGLEVLAYSPPGREGRAGLSAPSSWRDLVEDAAAAALGAPAGPIAFYGHSMGALLAFDAAAKIAAKRPAFGLFLGARAFPANGFDHYAEVSKLADDELFARLEVEFGAAPPSVDDPEIRALAADRLRTDLAVMATRPTGAGPPKTPATAAPLVAITGEEDPSTPPEAIAGWAGATTGGFATMCVAGGHYFVAAAGHEILARVAASTPPGA